MSLADAVARLALNCLLGSRSNPHLDLSIPSNGYIFLLSTTIFTGCIQSRRSLRKMWQTIYNVKHFGPVSMPRGRDELKVSRCKRTRKFEVLNSAAEDCED